MTTCQGLITRAMRLIGQLEAGGTPSTTELADGLESLQAMINSQPALMLGGPWTDVDVTEDYEAGEDERVRLTDPLSTVTITLPATIEDSYEETGYRAPRNGARVQVVGVLSGVAYRAIHVYVGYLGAWSRIDNLALADSNPFGPEHDDGLAAMLAVRIAPEYSAAISQPVAEMAARGRAVFGERFRTHTVTEAEYY